MERIKGSDLNQHTFSLEPPTQEVRGKEDSPKNMTLADINKRVQKRFNDTVQQLMDKSSQDS